MATRCSIIIYDDFGNVLIAERGKKSERTWGIFGKELRDPQPVGANVKPLPQAQPDGLFSIGLCDSGFLLLPVVLVFHISWAPSNAE